MAQPLPERVSFPGMEEEMLKLWEKLDAFKTSLELSKGKPEFTVSEYPPSPPPILARGIVAVPSSLSRPTPTLSPFFLFVPAFFFLHLPNLARSFTTGLPLPLACPTMGTFWRGPSRT